MSQVSEALQEIRSLAHEFAAAEVRPHVERWDHDAALGEGSLAQVAELGFFGMLVPESHGGMQLEPGTWLAALEELAWGEPSLALAVAFHAQVVRLLDRHGSDALKQAWLERLGTGAAIGCLALAEAGAGAEPDAVTCTATRAGDGWTLSGEKRWVSNRQPGGALVVLARAPEGPSLFLVPADAPGISAGARDRTLGLRPLHIGTLALADVRVEDGARIGEPGGAAAVLAGDVPSAALAVAAIATGIAQAALDHARGYADVREQFGRKLRHFEGLQHKLADMVIRTRAARALLHEAAASGDATAASAARVFAAEAAMFVTTQAVQVFGGYGYMRDYPVEKLMRDARAMSLLGGADEQHRVAIAEALYQD